jgi:(1->4)-alpha-D-glucan 1-alpha-D-glucosylmutase
LLYQTLIGAWPAEWSFGDAQGGVPGDARAAFAGRIREYMTKALREAKIHTSWISPNHSWEGAMAQFINGILAEESPFLGSFAPFQQRIARAGALNSLSALVLRIASPGVPDIYQGSELWNLTLVDPDNRQPVDFGVRQTILNRVRELESRMPEEAIACLLASPADGAIKFALMRRLLQFRRTAQELFSSGSYLPLRPAGPKQRHVVAFARQHGQRSAIAVAGRFFLSLKEGDAFPPGPAAWKDTVLLLRKELGSGPWRDVLTGRLIPAPSSKARLDFSELFAVLPAALLVSEVGNGE